MPLQWIAILALALAVQGCSSYHTQNTGQVHGQRYKTKIDCVRTERPYKFDSHCDVPVLGYSGFSAL